MKRIRRLLNFANIVKLSGLSANFGKIWTSRTVPSDSFNIAEWDSVIYGNSMFVAISAYYGAIMSSSDGVTWVPRFISNTPSGIAYGGFLLKSIAYGAGMFVIVCADGSTLISSDGISWSRGALSGAPSAAIAYGNGTFVAVGLGTVSTSPDGIIWTSRTSINTTASWNSVIYADSLFIAVAPTSAASTSVTFIMSSPDGITWTSNFASLSSNFKFNSVVYANSLFVVVGWATSAFFTECVVTSPDGITWTQRTGGVGIATPGWLAVTFGNSVFVAVGYQSVMTSSDGITWTSGTISAHSWCSLVYADSIFVTVSKSDGVIATSPDGITWTLQTSASFSSWSSVASSPSKSVVISSETSNALTSSDGITWTLQTTPDAWSDIVYVPSIGFIAVGADVYTSLDGVTWTFQRFLTDNLNGVSISYSSTFGKIISISAADIGFTSAIAIFSTNGTTWTNSTTLPNYVYWGVSCGTSIAVAVGIDGTVVSTSDGITWTSRTAASSSPWSSVTYGNNLFVAVAYDGAVMTSLDGITWTSRTAASLSIWGSVTFGNNLFVAVAYDGAVMTSLDGITWTSRTAASNGVWSSVEYGNNMLVAVSRMGQLMTSS